VPPGVAGNRQGDRAAFRTRLALGGSHMYLGAVSHPGENEENVRTNVVRISLGIVAAGSMLLVVPARADVAGKVSSVAGSAEVQPGGVGSWKQLSVDDEVSVGDHLRTANGGRLSVVYRDGSAITLEPGSELIIDDQALPSGGPPVSLFSLNRGKLDVAVPKGLYNTQGARFEVKTTTAVAGVRGTQFTIEAEE
jgi:hypothetical protein